MSDNNSKAKALHIALSGHNLLICGAAGTGKSFTIGHIVRELEKVGKNVSLTCTTGIACSLYREMSLNATTLHRWSGIDDGRYNACEIKGVIENNVKYSNIVNRIKKTDILIIDDKKELSENQDLLRQFSSVIQSQCVNLEESNTTRRILVNIFKKIVKSYLMILVSQFRKDLLDLYNVEKKWLIENRSGLRSQIIPKNTKLFIMMILSKKGKKGKVTTTKLWTLAPVHKICACREIAQFHQHQQRQILTLSTTPTGIRTTTILCAKYVSRKIETTNGFSVTVVFSGYIEPVQN